MSGPEDLLGFSVSVRLSSEEWESPAVTVRRSRRIMMVGGEERVSSLYLTTSETPARISQAKFGWLQTLSWDCLVTLVGRSGLVMSLSAREMISVRQSHSHCRPLTPRPPPPAREYEQEMWTELETSHGLCQSRQICVSDVKVIVLSYQIHLRKCQSFGMCQNPKNLHCHSIYLSISYSVHCKN